MNCDIAVVSPCHSACCVVVVHVLALCVEHERAVLLLSWMLVAMARANSLNQWMVWILDKSREGLNRRHGT